MDWIFSPPGSYVVGAIIVILATAIFWKREPLKRWFRNKEVTKIELSAGPLKATLAEKSQAKPQENAPAGVSFGKDNDFGGAKIRDVAGRDIRRGAAASTTKGGRTPGVDFGEAGKFTGAEIEDVAGRDIVED